MVTLVGSVNIVGRVTVDGRVALVGVLVRFGFGLSQLFLIVIFELFVFFMIAMALSTLVLSAEQIADGIKKLDGEFLGIMASSEVDLSHDLQCVVGHLMSLNANPLGRRFRSESEVEDCCKRPTSSSTGPRLQLIDHIHGTPVGRCFRQLVGCPPRRHTHRRMQ